jgi:hypothetical protein
MPSAVGAVAILAAAGAANASAAPPTVSPLPGTPDASPRTQISFLGVAPDALKAISVTGSRSGRHRGRLAAYSNGDGASFVPDRPFRQGERVRVLARAAGAQVRTAFTVARIAPYHFNTPSPPKPIPPGTVTRFVSRADLVPPVVNVTINSPAATPGDVFVAPNSGPGQAGPMIVDPQGQVVWFQPVPRNSVGMDFQVQSYEGHPALVWWQGYIANLGVGFGTDVIYDSSYRQIGAVSGGNGYRADLHEIQLGPDGSALITASALVHADLSRVGGPRVGTLLDSIVQRVDVKTGLVMFEWHAYGHIALSRSYRDVPHSSRDVWDCFHVNSVSPGPNGNLLVSSRNTWAGYSVSPTTGRVLWALGGRRPTFRMGSGTQTAWQHDMRWQPDGTITVFDNGDAPRVHPQTRIFSERIDFVHHRTRLVASQAHSPALRASSQGNFQLLADGDRFVGWGSAHYMSEYDSSGRVVYDAHLRAPTESYRAFRFPWHGMPAAPPAAAARHGGSGTDTVYASWNGATEVAAWRVLGGAAASSLAPLAQAPRSGFETAISVHASSTYEVQALDASGRVLGTSAAVRAR